MKITREMRRQRALVWLEREKVSEEEQLKRLDGIRITEVIIMRNKKALYLAEIDQMIRNIRAELAEDQLAQGIMEGRQ